MFGLEEKDARFHNPLERSLEGYRSLVKLLYGSLLFNTLIVFLPFTDVFGVFTLFVLIGVAAVKMDSARGTIYRSHLVNYIKSAFLVFALLFTARLMIDRSFIEWTIPLAATLSLLIIFRHWRGTTVILPWTKGF